MVGTIINIFLFLGSLNRLKRTNRYRISDLPLAVGDSNKHLFFLTEYVNASYW